MNLNPVKPYFDAIAVGAAMVLLIAVGVLGYKLGQSRWSGKWEAEVTAHAETKAGHAATLRGLAEKTAEAAAKARAASNAANAAREANDVRFNHAMAQAEAERLDLRNRLRRGAERLRPEWSCAATGPAAGGTGPAASRQDAGADLRQAGAADLIAAADHADGWIVWLQAELISTRKACGVQP